MTGFIRGLFNGKAKAESEPKPEPKVEAPKPVKQRSIPVQRDSNAFFLDSNEAQTYGNLEYMRAAKKVKRTFPKTADQPEEMEFIQEVSATKRIIETGKKVSVPNSVVKPQDSQQPTIAVQPDPSTQRRKADSSMDMFRNMAKEIRK
ncbi:MAG: hypothetical protein HC780_07300 [Leptolyngbyaceae cyanobacterium CSU_1_3]|nr:hypothetical protein [Leptolyngbyaceae cyanobacterium CSU_1_3]